MGREFKCALDGGAEAEGAPTRGAFGFPFPSSNVPMTECSILTNDLGKSETAANLSETGIAGG